MAAKRRVKRGSRRAGRNSRSASRVSGKSMDYRKKLYVSLRSLITFAVLSAVSYILYGYVAKEIYANFFYITAIVSGFVAIAFLMVYLILLFMKWLKK